MFSVQELYETEYWNTLPPFTSPHKIGVGSGLICANLFQIEPAAARHVGSLTLPELPHTLLLGCWFWRSGRSARKCERRESGRCSIYHHRGKKDTDSGSVNIRPALRCGDSFRYRRHCADSLRESATKPAPVVAVLVALGFLHRCQSVRTGDPGKLAII